MGDQASFESLITVLRSTLHQSGHMWRKEDLVRSEPALMQVLAEVRQYMNSFAWVDKLPSEILAQIFNDTIELSGDGGVVTLGPYRPRHRPLLVQVGTLIRVSTKWRAIALETPSLWTRIYSGGWSTVEPVEEYLHRSQSRQISLYHVFGEYLYSESAKPLPLRQLLEENGQRIRRLDIWATRYPTAPLRAKTSLCPFLECLTIATQSKHYGHGQERRNYTSLLFSTRVSTLKALALDGNAWTGLPANRFPHLTHLYISYRYLGYGDPQSKSEPPPNRGGAYDILHLLANTPALRYLHISALELVGKGRSPVPVALNSLRVLTCVKSELRCAFLLLELLKFPEDAMVRLDLLSDRHYPGEVQYPHRIGSSRRVTSFTHLGLWVSHTRLNIVAEGEDSAFWLLAEADWQHRPCDSWWISGLHAMLPLAAFRILHVTHTEPNVLLNLLPRMPGLTDLFIHDNNENSTYASVDLVGTLFTMLAGDEQTPCCPILNTLYIGYRSHRYSPENFFIQGANRMAASRSRKGMALRRILLKPYPQDDEARRAVASMQAAIAPVLEHVDLVEIVEELDPALCTFKMRDMWNVDGPEDYWNLPDEERMPKYLLWCR